jgi:hypothetical protein
MERIMEQNRALMKTFNVSGNKILIGAEDYQELMQSPEFSQVTFKFDASAHLDLDGESTLCGFKVEVIPWMRGVLMMP